MFGLFSPPVGGFFIECKKMTKAYSTLQIKSVSDDERIITGIATTAMPDRDDDVIEPTGVKFSLPIPLLWQHNHNQPIGEVTQAEITENGILITAKIAKIEEDGKLKERTDEAWQSIKSGLVKCLSIGFKTLEYNYLENSWGLHIKSWEWYELSVVTVPANPQATITSVKQIKQAFDDSPALGANQKSVSDITQKVSFVKLINPNQGGVKLS